MLINLDIRRSILHDTHCHFYASTFRRRRHYVFGLSVRSSVRPSVRSLKHPLLTCTWVRWSTRPTVTILRHVRPSVRPSVCPSVRPSGEVSGHLPENAWRECPEILHADESWPLQDWLIYGHSLLIFLILALFWLSETGQIWGFPAISWRTHGGNGLKICTLMYLDHFKYWLVHGNGQLIFLILALFWLCETGEIWGFRAFPGEHMEEMAWNFARWCILTTLRID